MTERKWTPGLWMADFGEAFHIRPLDGGTLANVTFLKGRGGLGGRREPEECAANANLIAAAPDLYESLEMAIADGVPMRPDTIHKAHAALAKARGE